MINCSWRREESILDRQVKDKIYKKYTIRSKEGLNNFRQSNAIYLTYLYIKHYGYEALISSRSQVSFLHVKKMVDAGISLTFLKSIKPPIKNNT